MDRYPHMFSFAHKRPICSKSGCKNEALWYTWMTATGGSRVVDGWNVLVSACNVHVREYSDAVVVDIAKWMEKYKSKQKGGEQDGVEVREATEGKVQGDSRG